MVERKEQPQDMLGRPGCKHVAHMIAEHTQAEHGCNRHTAHTLMVLRSGCLCLSPDASKSVEHECLKRVLLHKKSRMQEDGCCSDACSSML